MAQGKIRIRLKGYDHQQLDRSAQQIVDTAQRSGATITGPVPLPTEKNVYCVIRSPFKDKDSREHFEVRTHKRLIDILSPTPKTIDQLMRLDLPAGVDNKIKVAGIGIGKGFQGTIKRHNFGSGPRSHGSHNIRKPGSIGASATPSRVRKGMKMAGRMGGKRVTQLGLTVFDIDSENNLLLVKGAVPGPRNGIVEVRG